MSFVNRITAEAYYNEYNEHAAEWIEGLIRLGVVAPGVVDRRSIEDVQPDDLRGFRQCHFFAGIGVWSYALRRAGLSDDVAVWTGSPPCQPFSAAGKGDGVDDERHLWPAFFGLIEDCRPQRLYGEQVASKDGLAWLDIVFADLETAGYAVWTVDTCSAGVGAPHIRQRLRICADDLRSPAGGLQYTSRYGRRKGWSESIGWQPSSGCGADGMDDLFGTRLERHWWNGNGSPEPGRIDAHAAGSTAATGATDNLADTSSGRVRAEEFGEDDGTQSRVCCETGKWERVWDDPWANCAGGNRTGERRNSRPGPTNGFWRTADWLFCRDERWRPVAPGSFPLVDGAAFRNLDSGSPYAGKKRASLIEGAGNAIDAEATRVFIESTLDCGVDGTSGLMV